MRTIGRRLPDHVPRLDHQTACDHCGVAYYRSDLVRQADGLLACERDRGGDVVTISRENAQGAKEPIYDRGVWDSGGQVTSPVETPPVYPWPDGVQPVSK